MTYEEFIKYVDQAHGKERSKAVKTLLEGIPKEGGFVSRSALTKLISVAFNGGVTAAKMRHEMLSRN